MGGAIERDGALLGAALVEPEAAELIPGLPDDVAMECLARVPSRSHRAVRRVCRGGAARPRRRRSAAAGGRPGRPRTSCSSSRPRQRAAVTTGRAVGGDGVRAGRGEPHHGRVAARGGRGEGGGGVGRGVPFFARCAAAGTDGTSPSSAGGSRPRYA